MMVGDLQQLSQVSLRAMQLMAFLMFIAGSTCTDWSGLGSQCSSIVAEPR